MASKKDDDLSAGVVPAMAAVGTVVGFQVNEDAGLVIGLIVGVGVGLWMVARLK